MESFPKKVSRSQRLKKIHHWIQVALVSYLLGYSLIIVIYQIAIGEPWIAEALAFIGIAGLAGFIFGD